MNVVRIELDRNAYCREVLLEIRNNEWMDSTRKDCTPRGWHDAIINNNRNVNDDDDDCTYIRNDDLTKQSTDQKPKKKRPLQNISTYTMV